MIAAWMLYALLVSVLMALGAWLLEGAVRMRGGPVRFLWLGALLATVALVALAPLRSTPPAPLPSATFVVPAATEGAVQPAGGFSEMAAQALRIVRDALARPVREIAALGTDAAGTALGAGWALASALLLALVAATALRAGRARRRWPRADVAGVDVRVAPEAGPAVMGILRPEIVVPAWLLDASADEQRLVVLHEREHVRARDPMLLAAGCVAAALVPWSPAAWWMLLRLRAAVELDCDARVLRGGVARRTYGSLLIDMAGRGPGLSLGSPALAGSPSTLERRLRAMNTRIPRFSRLRASLLGVLGVALLAGACETQFPTSAELERMDVAAMEARSLQLHPSAEGRTITYIVDNREVTAQEAHALAADRIAQVNIEGGTAEGRDIVRIYTNEGRPTVVPDGENRGHAPTPARDEGVARTAFDGLILIDGVISDPATLHRLAPDDIAQVDVLKGAAASAQYSDPRAANGVIRVTTKAAAGTNR